jgi:hypothetical protein
MCARNRFYFSFNFTLTTLLPTGKIIIIGLLRAFSRFVELLAVSFCFPFSETKLFSTLATSRNRSDPILVVSLGLLARAENITLRDDQG